MRTSRSLLVPHGHGGRDRASLELKAGLGRDRAKLFTAIAEAAANSRWANEAWLVFADWSPSDQPLDEDVVSLARSVEVGLIEIRVSGTLETLVHHAAPTRATLRSTAIAAGVVTTASLGSVIREAADGALVKKAAEALRMDIDAFGESVMLEAK